MNRAFSHEFYLDMKDDDYGKKVVHLSCSVTNGKRFSNLNEQERRSLAKMIDLFQKQLTLFREEILTGAYQPESNNPSNKQS